jgi:chorismate mutase
VRRSEMEGLDDYRKNIDELDKKITELFEKRMDST